MRLAPLAPALALALVPSAAPALSATVNGSTVDRLVGASLCQTQTLTLAWDLQVAPNRLSTERVRAMATRASSSCTSNPPSPTPDLSLLDAAPTTQTDSVSTSAAAMAFGPDGGTPGCDNPDLLARRSSNPVTNYLCVQYFDGTSLVAQTFNVKYAFAKPIPPTAPQIAPGNQHLKVSWAQGDPADDIATYDVHVVPQGTVSDGGVAKVVTTTNADVSRTDDNQPLQNDAGYSVTVVAHDTYGNISDPSAEAIGTPVPSSDFYDHYRNLGGSAEGGGGCASGGTSAFVAIGALAVALFFRRSRRIKDGAALVALFALLAPAVRAEDTPRPRFLAAFKMDRYDPKVDSEPGLTGTPYHDVFGTRVPFRYQLEFDWEVAHPMGSFLVGATVGFWQNYGKAVLLSSTPGNPQPSQDTTLLNVFPFGLIATYRFDWLAERWERFPLIPYAQAGFMRALWVSYDGLHNVSTSSAGGRGSGWTSGYTTALGIALSLNSVDPALAREAYLDTGIQRTSLFAEYGWTYLSNFNSRGALILTDRAWRFGISVEF